jgi:hypothetical protein
MVFTFKYLFPNPKIGHHSTLRLTLTINRDRQRSIINDSFSMEGAQRGAFLFLQDFTNKMDRKSLWA